MSEAHRAVEQEDLVRLRQLLDTGTDVNAVEDGWTLLHHAVDVEIDGHNQTGDPLHVDVTAFLLARGADPSISVDGGQTPFQMAFSRGHWLAVTLMEAISSRRPQ